MNSEIQRAYLMCFVFFGIVYHLIVSSSQREDSFSLFSFISAVFCFTLGLGAQFESSSEGFIEEEINGKALLTINVEYLSELSV